MTNPPLRSIGILMPQGWEGGRRYFHNMVQALAEEIAGRNLQIALHVFCPDDALSALQTALPQTPFVHAVPRAGFLRSALALRAFSARCDVVLPYLAMPYADQFFFWRSPARVAWIADLQHRIVPRFFSMNECQKRDQIFRRTLWHADLVLVSSRDTEESIRSCYGATEKIEVVPFRSFITDVAVDPLPVSQSYGLPERFFLVANQWWTHKNHRVIIDAFYCLREQGIRPVVVCTGDVADYRSPAAVTALLHDAQSLVDDSQMFILGNIPRQDQLQLLRQSIALVQPSLFEGWNTGLEEARFFGKQTIVSDLPVHREQDIPGALYSDPSDVSALAKHMRALWETASPGPNVHEDEAKRMYAALQSAFGARILDIAEKAHRLHHGG